MSDRHPNVVNVSEVETIAISGGTRFEGQRRMLGMAAGGKHLGCSHYQIPAGKRGFPFHYHLANEEAVYILEGEGTFRLGDREIPIKPGDYIAIQPGPSLPHQIINTSAGPLRYLAMSTRQEPEIAVYPDSKKVGIWGGSRSADAAGKQLLQLHKLGESLGYYDGED